MALYGVVGLPIFSPAGSCSDGVGASRDSVWLAAVSQVGAGYFHGPDRAELSDRHLILGGASAGRAKQIRAQRLKNISGSTKLL